MKSLLPLGALVLLIATLACTEVVDGDGGGAGGTTATGGTTNSGGTGGTTSGTGGTGGLGGAGGSGGAVSNEAIALLYSQFPASSSGSTSTSSGSSSSSSGSSSSSTSTSSTSTSTSTTSTSSTSTSTTSTSTSTTTSSGAVDPNTLFIILSNQDVACSDPDATACGQWRLEVGIPPSLQQLGQISLSNSELISHYSMINPSCNGSSGGSFVDGTLELLTLSSMEVTGIFSNTSTFDVDVNGPFTAPRCP